MGRILGLRRVRRVRSIISCSADDPLARNSDRADGRELHGQRIPGYHVEQSCATGLQAVLLGGNEVQAGGKDVVGADV